MQVNYFCKRNILYLCLLSAVVACESKKAETKFVTLDQQNAADGWIFNPNILIKHVHTKEWKIFYRFADDQRCNGQFSNNEHLTQLKDKVKESIRVWLQPLRDNKQGIVIDENIKLEEDTLTNSQVTPSMLRSENESYHLHILFYCEEGRSFADPRGDYFKVHVYQNKNLGIGNYLAATTLHKFDATTIHHEIGHAFGLGDTYIETSRAAIMVTRFNKSTGGDERTVGKQPISVMNFSGEVGIKSVFDQKHGEFVYKLVITPDDIAGIRHLYRQHIEKSIDTCDCPYDYVYEKETGGCLPDNPPIFAAAKHGSINLRETLYIYDDWEERRTVINQQDRLGNTALHYAAASKQRHGDSAYLTLLGEKHYDGKVMVDTTIKNKLGYTAEEIYVVEDPAPLLMSAELLVAVQESKRAENAKVCRQTALRLAITSAQVAEVEELLQSDDIDINKQGDFGLTALHTAVSLAS